MNIIIIKFIRKIKYSILLITILFSVDSDTVCEVTSGGFLGHYKNVAIPGVPLDLPPVTPKDKKDIDMGIAYSVDAIFLPFVRNAYSVEEVREFLGKYNKKKKKH